MGDSNGSLNQFCSVDRIMEAIEEETSKIFNIVSKTNDDTEEIKQTLQGKVDELVSLLEKLINVIITAVKYLVGVFLLSWFIDHFSIETLERVGNVLGGFINVAKSIAQDVF